VKGDRRGLLELVTTRKHVPEISAPMAKPRSESALTAEEMLTASPEVTAALSAAQMARMFKVYSSSLP
jgi:hypothetical protein